MSKAPNHMLLALIIFLSAREALSADEVDPKITYGAFLAAVRSNHPELVIDQKNLAKAREQERRAGLLADPQLSIGRDQVPLPMSFQKNMLEVERSDTQRAQSVFGMSQTFPWPGTLSSEEHAAKARVATVDADTRLAAKMRDFEARELYLRLIKTANVLEAERANLAVVISVRDFAHEKFKQGAGSHMEFLQSHSEAGVLKANVAALAADLRNLERHALVLMGITPTSNVDFVLEWPATASDPLPKDAEVQVDLTKERIARAKEVDLARQDVEYRRSLPVFVASGMLMQEDSGMRMYATMVGVTVPIFSNIQRSSLSAEQAIIAGRADNELSWHEKRKELALAQAQSRLGQIETSLQALEREIIPPVREHIDAATTQFSQGRGDIGSIIESRRTLLNLQVAEARMKEALALAQLSIEKINAGLIDEVLDAEMPQLVSASMNAIGMGASGSSASMQGMAAQKRGMPMKKSVSGNKPTPSRDLEDDLGTKKGGGPGMGM